MRFTGEPLIPTLDAAKQAIASYPDFDKFGYGRWASVLKETQIVIGFCGLKDLADLDAVDVGYRFLPPYWGGVWQQRRAWQVSISASPHSVSIR